MKYPSHGEYKTSDSAWLPTIPAAWQQIRGRFVMSVNPAAVRLRDLDEADEVSFVPMEAVGENGGLNLERTKPLDEIGSGYTEFEDGDVVIAKITPCFENGKSAIASGLMNGVAFGTTELHVLRVGKRLDKQFLFHLTTSHTFRMLGESEMYGAGGQKRVPPEFAKDFRIPLPPINEQQAIARFLDAKTAQIDDLIAKKRQLIDKLNEKRSALIARTVTRGLPPEAAEAAGLEANPKMKDSGGAWFGLIPSHWDCKPIKHVAQIGNGSTPARDNPDYWEYGEFPWLNSSVVNAGEVLLSDQFVTGAALRQCHLPIVKPPAVLVGITGEGRTRGMAAILLIEATINQHVAYVKPRDALADVRYLWRIFQFAYSFLRSESEGGGSTKGAITCDQIANLKIPLPSVPEQRAIASYLDCEAKKIDKLVAKAFIAITRLTEYRQALITSAVTGKIDVRETPTLPEAA